LEKAAEDYYEDELQIQAPIQFPTTQPPTTQLTTTTTKPTTTKPTTTSKTTTTKTVDPRKALEPRVVDLLNSLSSLETKVNAAKVQDQTCKERISSNLVVYLASGLQLETNFFVDAYSKDLNILMTLEGNLMDISNEWTECLARTTSTTSTSTTTTTRKPTTTTTTTRKPTTTTTTTEEPTTLTTMTEEPTTLTTTTEEPTTTVTEEIKLKESIREFTIDPPKEEYAREPDLAQDDEIEKQLLDEIKRTEEMIEKQKQAIIVPMVIVPIIEESEEIPEITVAPITPTPQVTNTKKVIVKTVATTTTVHPQKHMLHPGFKGLQAIRDKPPEICNESMDLYYASRYAKSVCVINQNVSYDDAHEICAREEMDLFAIQSMDHHLVCRHQLHHLFKSVPSYWINGRHINDLWYYFHSENKGQKRFIYPGTQFDGPHTGSCLRLMKFTVHNTIAANAADCDLELPLFCEYYIEQ